MADQQTPETVEIMLDQVLNTLKRIRNDAGNIPVKLRIAGDPPNAGSPATDGDESEGTEPIAEILEEITEISVRRIEPTPASPERIFVIIG